jgi:hypothetical protein
MKIKNVTQNQLEMALKKINKEKYEENVIWNRFDPNGRGFNVTLRVKSSKSKGHSLGYYFPPSGHKARRLVSACWHVHGYFFEALLEVEPNVVIISRGNRIDKNGGNWEDWNAGSIMYPQYMSEKCECLGEY